MLFVALACPALAQDDGGPPASDQAQAATDLNLVSAVERVVSRAIAKAERSVVSVARRKRLQSQQFAADTHPGISRVIGVLPEGNAPSDFSTGVVIDASGLVLTNNHVLGDSHDENEYSITTVDRKTFDVKVKASDATSDLAVLELISPTLRRPGDFTPIEFGDAATLQKGQIVIALGNPYGIARDGQASASWGIVANLSRKAAPAAEDELQKQTLHELGTLIQTDARLNLGTSGGALINVRGQMVGLTTSLAAVAGFEQAAGYAIPVDKAFLRIIQVLKERREVEYGMLGITLPSNSFRPKTGTGIQGVVINEIVRNGPASKAKLSQGDIITHIEGKPIYDFDGLRLQISKFAPETPVTLTVVRSGSSFERPVVLGKLPINLPQTFTEKPTPWRGATIDYRRPINRNVAPFFAPHLDELSAPCVAVREIEEDSPAWEAGLRQGTLITHVGSVPVEKPADFYKAVSAHAGAVKLTLLATDGSKSTVTVAAE